MHEFALADAVVTTALRAAKENGIATIERVEVRIGELQRISRETFEFALSEMMPNQHPMLGAAKLDLVVEPATFRCRPCGREFALDDTGGPKDKDKDEAEAIHFIPELAHAYLACPACSSPDFEVLTGRGVTIGAIEGDSG